MAPQELAPVGIGHDGACGSVGTDVRKDAAADAGVDTVGDSASDAEGPDVEIGAVTDRVQTKPSVGGADSGVKSTAGPGVDAEPNRFDNQMPLFAGLLPDKSANRVIKVTESVCMKVMVIYAQGHMRSLTQVTICETRLGAHCTGLHTRHCHAHHTLAHWR